MKKNNMLDSMMKAKETVKSTYDVVNNDLILLDNSLYKYLDNENYRALIKVGSISLNMLVNIRPDICFNDLNLHELEYRLKMKAGDIELKHGLIPKRVTDKVFDMYKQELASSHNEFRFYIVLIDNEYDMLVSQATEVSGMSVKYNIVDDLKMISQHKATVVACCHSHTGFGAWFSEPDRIDTRAWPSNVIHIVIGEPSMCEFIQFGHRIEYKLSAAIGIVPANYDLVKLYRVNIFEDDFISTDNNKNYYMNSNEESMRNMGYVSYIERDMGLFDEDNMLGW